MREYRMTPIGANVFGIHLKQDDEGRINGLITGGRIERPIPFTSISRMILLLEEQLDLETNELPMKAADQGEPPTFEIEIMFRQNYSWQGKIRWPAAGKEASFRSTLDLITIIELILEK